MKDQGELAELKFYYEAFNRGITVSKPFGDNQKYDFITDNNGRLKRVQVKSVSTKTKTSTKRKKYRPLIAHGRNTKKLYTKNQVDLICIFIIPEDVFYLVPIEKVNVIRLTLYPNGNFNKKHHRGAGKYEEFKEAWNLL